MIKTYHEALSAARLPSAETARLRRAFVVAVRVTSEADLERVVMAVPEGQFAPILDHGGESFSAFFAHPGYVAAVWADPHMAEGVLVERLDAAAVMSTGIDTTTLPELPAWLRRGGANG